MEFEYHSFLLRLWVTGKTEEQEHWMASLETVSTNEKMVFSSIEALIDYLRSITREPNYEAKKGDG
jgi:hypothetical protein